MCSRPSPVAGARFVLGRCLAWLAWGGGAPRLLPILALLASMDCATATVPTPPSRGGARGQAGLRPGRYYIKWAGRSGWQNFLAEIPAGALAMGNASFREMWVARRLGASATTPRGEDTAAPWRSAALLGRGTGPASPVGRRSHVGCSCAALVAVRAFGIWRTETSRRMAYMAYFARLGANAWTPARDGNTEPGNAWGVGGWPETGPPSPDVAERERTEPGALSDRPASISQVDDSDGPVTAALQPRTQDAKKRRIENMSHSKSLSFGTATAARQLTTRALGALGGRAS
jgi:hypothetical protein